MSSPLVSVCCLTYNHAKFLPAALDSFIMQRTSFNFEILVHDDASTDGTTEILRSYADAFPHLVKPRYEEENQFRKTGVYPLAKLYRAAAGRYIADCDGDDYWTDSDKLQAQADFLEANPESVMCHHDYLILERGSLRSPHALPPRDYSGEELIGYDGSGYGIGCCTRMFRNLWSAETAADIEAMAGDYPMIAYLGMFGKCTYLPGIMPSVYRRLHGGNSWCSLPPAEMARRTGEMNRKIHGFFVGKGNSAHIEARRAFLG
jgi:glycosyltransferase involved in cell wall biosynthesis